MARDKNKIHTAIIPAAGWGTRFLPATKAMPKEMLPVVDKPVIQFVVEEMVSAGIPDIGIITGYHKRAIEDHFDRSIELEEHLDSKDKHKELDEIKDIADLANFIYIRQKGNKNGNAMAVLSGEPLVDFESFIVAWGDEFIYSDPPRIQQMLDVYNKHGGIVISAMRIDDPQKLSRYGVAKTSSAVEPGVFKIEEITEKPAPGTAPSNLAMIGAYILPNKIFDIIRGLKPSVGGEYQLVDAINELIRQGYPAYACEIKNGKYYDTGNKVEYLKTVVEFALRDPKFEEFRQFLKNLKI